jgi:hypothetical protein
MRPLGLLFLLFLLLAVSRPLGGQTIRSVAVEVDNDAFNLWQTRNERPDEQYTHGARIRLRLAMRPFGPGFPGMSAPICGTNPGAEPCVYTDLEIGQAIFTPVDPRLPSVTLADWLEHDHRQHAGWLYVGVTARRVSAGGIRDVGLQAGVTGSPSLARQTQEWFHRRQKTETVPGWENQIPFEIGVNARFRERRSVQVGGGARALSLAFEPTWGASLGTVRTAAELGGHVRLAGNAARPFGWMGVPSGPHFYLEVGAFGELVLRDAFLDGTTSTDGSDVEKEPFLSRRELGVGLGWGAVLLEFRVLALGPEFRNQIRDHTYSSIGVTASW